MGEKVWTVVIIKLQTIMKKGLWYSFGKLRFHIGDGLLDKIISVNILQLDIIWFKSIGWNK